MSIHIYDYFIFLLINFIMFIIKLIYYRPIFIKPPYEFIIDNMEKICCNCLPKNIPISSKTSYNLKLIEKIESATKWM